MPKVRSKWVTIRIPRTSYIHHRRVPPAKGYWAIFQVLSVRLSCNIDVTWQMTWTLAPTIHRLCNDVRPPVPNAIGIIAVAEIVAPIGFSVKKKNIPIIFFQLPSPCRSSRRTSSNAWTAIL
jgi:hypothetical protein